MENNVSVTVIIPVYNAQKHLKQCLDSVLGQSLKDIEVICVDDGSTDSSLDILDSYTKKDKRLSVICQKNQFAGIARNNGLKHAKGEYIAFLDSDDCYADSDALLYKYRQAKKYELDMLKTGFILLDSDTGKKYVTPYSLNSTFGKAWRRRIVCFDGAPDRLLQVGDVPWNGLYRREFLEQNKILFNGLRCVNDHSFYIHCLTKARRIMVTDRQTVHYRVQQSDSLIGKKANHYECQLESYRIVKALSEELSDELKQKVLRVELYNVFEWYRKLCTSDDKRQMLQPQLADFLKSYDENDVGEEYLQTFAFNDEYYRLRYESKSPKSRKGILSRAANALKNYGVEHVLLSVWFRVKEKTGGQA